MADPLGIAMSQRAETERDSKTGERLTREDRRGLAQEKAAADRNEALVKQRQILGFTKIPSTSGEVADDDEWGECAVVKNKSWVDCPCGNPVENQGDTFCEVCIAGAGRGGKNRVGLSRDDEWMQEFRRMLIAESEQEEKKGVARSRGAETERELRSGERLTREDRMRLAKETGGQKRGPILDLVNPLTSDDEVVDDEVWGRCRVVSREPWADCQCGNPVENRGETLCEACIILGVRTPGITTEKLEGRGCDLIGTNKWYPNSSRKREEDYEIEEIENTRKGIIKSRGAETERKMRVRDERFEGGGFRDGNPSREGSADRSSSHLILDLTNPPTGSGEVAEDEEWGSCTVVPREPWFNCPCGNPVENRGDTLCEVCKVLGVRRGAELQGLERSGERVETELYSGGLRGNEWYDSERKERRARKRGAEPLGSGNDGKQSAAVGGISMDDISIDKGKGKQDVRNEQERDLFDIPANVLDEVEPALIRTEELSSETITTIQEFRACNTTRDVSMGSTESREMWIGQPSGFGGGSAASYGRRYGFMMDMDGDVVIEMGSVSSRGDDLHVRRTGFGQSTLPGDKSFSSDARGAGMNSTRDQNLERRSQRTSSPGRHSPPPERLSFTEQLAKARAQSGRTVSAGDIEPPRPRPLVSFQPFRGVAESREVPVYQPFGKERSSDMEEYERWRAKPEEEQLEKDRQKMASLKATSRYASSFRPAQGRSQAKTALASGVNLASGQSLDAKTENGGAQGRNETASIPIATKVKDETERLESQSRARPESPSITISHEQAFKELWRQLCATNGLDSNDDTLKNLHEYRLRKISDQRVRCFMWYDWPAWDKDEESPQESQTENYDYKRPGRYPSPDPISEGRAIWDGRVMHFGTTWRNAVQFSKKGRYDEGGLYTLFVPRRKIYGPRCDICVKRKFSCDGMRPKCGFCTRLGHDCVVLIGRRSSSVERMKVEIAKEKVGKAAEDLESYKLPNLDKDDLDQEEAWLAQGHDQAKSRLEQQQTSLSEREERLKNLNEGRRSGWEHQTADSDSRSYYRGGECREDDNERVMWYGGPARIGFGRSAWSDREREGLCKDHRKPSSFVTHEKELASDGNQDISSRPDEETAREEQLRREKLLNEAAAAAAEEYESYRLTIWGKGGIDRKGVDLHRKVEMAEALLERLEREERPKVPQKGPGSEDQLGGKVHHRGSAQSREVPIYDRDSETRNAVSREAALRLEYEANCQRGVAPSRQSEAHRRNEDEGARQHRAFRLEELAKMKEFKQRQQEQGYSIGNEHLGDNNDGFRSRSTVDTTSAEKMAERDADKTISTRDRALTEEDEDELEARLEGLVLRTKVQVPEAMKRAMEKDEEWRSFA